MSRSTDTGSVDVGPLQLLLVQPDARRAADIERLLHDIDGRPIEIICCDRMMAAVDLLRSRIPDLVLLDPRLPDSKGCDPVDKLKVHAFGAPVILIETESREGPQTPDRNCRPMESLALGQLDAPRLEQAIRHALQIRRLEQRLTRLESEVKHALARNDLTVAAQVPTLNQADAETVTRVLSKLKQTLDLFSNTSVSAAAHQPVSEVKLDKLDNRAPELKVLVERIEELEVELRGFAGSGGSAGLGAEGGR